MYLIFLVLKGSIELDEEINLENLTSLEYLRLSLKSTERISIRNSNSLKNLSIDFIESINPNRQTKLFENLPNIETVRLEGDLYDFTLDGFYRLKSLVLHKTKNEGFNLLTNVCNQLENLVLEYVYVDAEQSTYKHNFTNLSSLTIFQSDIFLEKKLLDRFPSLQSLHLSTFRLWEIDADTFSNSTNLITLAISYTCIEKLEEKCFSSLINLENLYLSNNQIRYIEKNMFENLKKLKKLDLRSNKLEKLDPESFIGLENLKELNLSSNKLVDFDFGILDNLPNIETLNISHSTPNYKLISKMLFKRGINRF